MPARYMDPKERFWAKVAKGRDCWEWNGTITPSGYGHFYFEGRNHPAHRISYSWENGAIPDGLVVDHICRNKRCVRPTHLRAVTQRQNLLHGPTIIVAELSKTECVHGHPLSGDNLRLDRHGWRICRACERRRWTAKNERIKAENRAKRIAIARGGDGA